MATRPTRKYDKAFPVIVHVPSRVANIDVVHRIVCNTMGELGCPACLSGFSVTYTDLPYLVVDAKTNAVLPG